MQAIIRQWEQHKRRKMDSAKKKEIATATTSMIQAATMDDVREFSPIYQAVKHAPKKKGAAKRRVGIAVHRKAGGITVRTGKRSRIATKKKR